MERRTNSMETAHHHPQMELWPVGVGGRQGNPHRPSEGGGYLQTCTDSKFSPYGAEKMRDPRMEELKAMGLHWAWLKVAEEIGVDAFLAMWRVMDKVEQFQDERGHLEFSLRRYKSFGRYQRNLFVRQLHAHGAGAVDIRRRIEVQMGETLTKSTILRIISGEIK